MKQAFVEQQFRLRQAHYASYYPKAGDTIILVEEVPIGRCLVDRSGPVWCLVDIALFAGFRHCGIGGQLIGGLLADAMAQNRALGLSVERGNPARRLYDRLGFKVIEETEMRTEMLFTPPRAPE